MYTQRYMYVCIYIHKHRCCACILIAMDHCKIEEIEI